MTDIIARTLERVLDTSLASEGLADLNELRDLDDYMDWGESVKFEVDVSKGECAA